MRRQIVFAVLVVAGLLGLAGCQRQAGEGEIWAEVNGRPILRAEVEKRFQRQVALLPESLTEEEALGRKLSLLGEIIQAEILLQKAAQVGQRAGDSEVEARLEELRRGLTEEGFQAQLDERNMTLTELRQELRRDLSIRKLLEAALARAVEVSQEEMENYYQHHKESFHLVEAQYRVAVILVTPRRNLDVRNLQNHDARSQAEARQKIETLVERLQAGDDFSELARQFSEDSVTALSGGDLGFFPESSLEQSQPALRNTVRRLQEGQWAGPLATPQGTILVKLVEYEPPGQRQFDEPGVQKSIRGSLRRAKQQLLETAYIERARNQARVVNYLARQILESRRVAP